MTPQATNAAAAKPKTADMHPGPGFRVRPEIERPAESTVHGLGQFETPAISDQLNLGLSVGDFLAAVLGSIVISLVGFVLSMVVGTTRIAGRVA